LPLIRFALHNPKGTQRAFPDAGTTTIAKSFCNKVQLIVHNSERTFHAGFYAFPAAIAHRFIDMDYFSSDFHSYFLLRYSLAQNYAWPSRNCSGSNDIVMFSSAYLGLGLMSNIVHAAGCDL
jgi:hypothetical protein